MNIQLHEKLIDKQSELCDWFTEKSKDLFFPIYTSYDIRDSGYKISPVDANVFPAGFNNICAVDKESASGIMKQYIERNYGVIKKILIISEEHTKNLFYWENVYWIQKIILNAGYEVKVTFAKELEATLDLTTSMGNKVLVEPSLRDEGTVSIGAFVPDLIISNNDFTQDYSHWMKNLTVPLNPHYAMGWHRRKKSIFFKHYNKIAQEFCEIIDHDPWGLQIQTELVEGFSLTSEDDRQKLAIKVDNMIAYLAEKYKSHSVKGEPFVFIKNASGTYGMGVTQVHSGEEVLSWNSKARKKLKASKGNVGLANLILQEGIPTTVTEDDATAEPAIYMVGNQLAGGFLRVHKDKGPKDSLNSPGAVFKRLCVSDLELNAQSCCLENVYGWIGRLSALAVAQEASVLDSTLV
ncbi:MAG: glutamate--cysteine ligase [Bdellovibrionaceae bacterium]|jgi:glutamate--cysteine ligase|nr:glutamate--cysteine ligase [Pseudobdellovibrionaceae bacterium]